MTMGPYAQHAEPLIKRITIVPRGHYDHSDPSEGKALATHRHSNNYLHSQLRQC